MKILEIYETRKGNKLIFKQNSSDIPSIGSLVFSEIANKKDESENKKGKQKEIGTIIDVFGPVKEPWVVVNLNNDYSYDFTKSNFYWKKYDKKTFKRSNKKKKISKKSSAPYHQKNKKK